MAGMFYSMKEAAEKLNVTEEKIKELVQTGRLREFRDGPNLLFKVNEVEALLSDASLTSSVEQSIAAEGEAEPVVKAEPVEEEPVPEDLEAGTEISLELEADDTVAVESPVTKPAEEQATEEAKKAEIDEAAESEILLARTGSDSALSDLTSEELTSGDTALTSEGVNVLGETDSGYQLSEDTKGETQGTAAEEPSLEEIEEDVNLDSFGSGSGLLDLSLQADDTSLGGILDDIYMSEGEEGKEPVEGSAVAMSAEAEHIIEEEAPQASPVVPGIVPVHLESEPDLGSKILMVPLVLSLLVVIYTAIVALSASMGTKVSIYSMFQGYILYILIGCLALSVVFGGASFAVGGSSSKTKKPKAEKEKKKEKPKKEKKKKEKKKKSK
jgi:excisionase family DNA binding protein